MLPQLRSTMDNAMSDGDRQRHLGVDQKPTDTDDSFPSAGNGTFLAKQDVSARILCMASAALVADRLGLAGEQPFDP